LFIELPVDFFARRMGKENQAQLSFQLPVFRYIIADALAANT
jgi:hypothetical protein